MTLVSLPPALDSVVPAKNLPKWRSRWSSNEEVASILISFDQHSSWLSAELTFRPRSGSIFLYNRKIVPFKKDGYSWKTRRNTKTIREDKVHLKINSVECMSGIYVHSSIVPTFHRRTYWLLINPDVVMVHYLNCKSDEVNQVFPLFWPQKKIPDPEDLKNELEPMFTNRSDGRVFIKDINGLENVNSLVSYFMTFSVPPAVVFQCSCGSSKDSFSLESCSHSPRLVHHQTRENPSRNQPKYILPATTTNTPLIVNLTPVTIAASTASSFLIVTSSPPNSQVSSVISSAETNSNRDRLLSSLYVSTSSAITTQTVQSLQYVRSYSLPMTSQETSTNEPVFSTSQTSLPEATDDLFDSKDRSLPHISDTSLHSQTQSVPAVGLRQNEAQVKNEHQHSTSFTDDSLQSISAGITSDFDDDLFSLMNIPCDLAPSTEYSNNVSDIDIIDGLSSIQPSSDNLYDIVEYSPNWCFCEGGEKVLIAGSWDCSQNSHVFNCVFDTISVPADVVFNGLLRCISPSHPPGAVALYVMQNSQVVSKCVPFHYKGSSTTNNNSLLDKWMSLDDMQFRSQMIERISLMEGRILSLSREDDGFSHSNTRQTVTNNFEGRVTVLCNVLLQQIASSEVMLDSAPKGITLLHMAAALGMLDFLILLLQFSSCNIVDCNPCILDNDGCSPLFWACVRQHSECARHLFKSHPEMVTVNNLFGISPLDVVQQMGMIDLYELFTIGFNKSELTRRSSKILYDSTSEYDSDITSTQSSNSKLLSSLDTSSDFCSSFYDNDISMVDVNEIADDEIMQSDLEVFNIAQHIIRAMPERIKQTEDFNDGYYNYRDQSTPTSPASSYGSFSPDVSSIDSPIAMKDWCEFIQGSCVENKFNSMTLSDEEQRKLFGAAKVIQNAFRQYKQSRVEKEQQVAAAVLIQSYFRKYKQYSSYKRMANAAMIIQKLFRKRRNLQNASTNVSSTSDFSKAVILVQRVYRMKIRRKKENAAAIKIQRFLRQCKDRIQGLHEDAPPVLYYLLD